MFKLYKLIILIFFLVTASNKPIISPNQGQLVINEGEPLEITCTGSTPIKFIYPNDFGESVRTINFIYKLIADITYSLLN